MQIPIGRYVGQRLRERSLIAVNITVTAATVSPVDIRDGRLPTREGREGGREGEGGTSDFQPDKVEREGGRVGGRSGEGGTETRRFRMAVVVGVHDMHLKQ